MNWYIRIILCSSLIFVIFNLFCPTLTIAQDVANNKFGIHITDINEAQKAQELVNSNNGNWGYVTMTINSNDRNVGKWQERMNSLNEKNLIPIVRLTTYGNGHNWTVPANEDSKDWAEFLSKLYWPTKHRLIIVYNEPNHGTEWGGKVNPQEYARILRDTVNELKNRSNDFVVMNSGFDSSTPNEPPLYMDQLTYMDQMEKEVPGIFSMIDAWSSHSYPNPGFSGKSSDTGRGSIRSYEWELNQLRQRYKVQKKLPVYITETGWVYKNIDHPKLKYDDVQVGSFTVEAYESVWNKDSRVMAVTPFMLSYKSPLFSHFSWLQPNDSPTKIFDSIKSLTKINGSPIRDSRSALTKVIIPYQIPQLSQVVAVLTFKNTGNTIWTDSSGFSLSVDDEDKMILMNNFKLNSSVRIFPGQSHIFRFTLYTENITTNTQLAFQMTQNETPFGEKLLVPVKIYIKPKLNIILKKNDSATINQVQLKFKNKDYEDIFKIDSVPSNGFVGSFTSLALSPNEKTEITVNSKNRPVVVASIKIEEGSNTITINLPNEIPFWKRIFNF